MVTALGGVIQPPAQPLGIPPTRQGPALGTWGYLVNLVARWVGERGSAG